MSADNRTEINDCESGTGWSGDDSVSTNSDTGQFYEGSNSLSTQLSNADEQMNTTEDSLNTGTFNLDWSDSTLYLLVKDNLVDSFANGGSQFVIGDGTNLAGYDVGGYDAVGLPLPFFFNARKLDVSVIVAAPGSFATYGGSEASLDQTQVTQIGYGALHLAKAVGSVDNVFMDSFKYIANGSYALTINGGSSGTPETMADVAGDDITNGWGMISNPVGALYYFFAPTEWGESAASADHYFTASDEQWFWLGDNGGGHAIGTGNFPFRVVGNATDTGSFVLTRVSITNTGTPAEFDMSNSDVNTLEITGCTFIGLGAIQAPSSGGTSRFCLDSVFNNCARVDHNGADMSGCSILNSAVAADEGALFYDETTDPDGEMDNMTFSKGANAHHAIRFGTNVPATMTLRGCDFSGFGSSGDSNDSVFRFDDTSGNITLNLINCTHDGSGFTVDDAAGVTVTIVIDPVTTKVTVEDEAGSPIQNARVLLETADDGGGAGFPYQDSVSITQASGTATVSHTAHGLANNDFVVIRGAQPDGYNKAAQITVTGANSYTYSVDSGLSSPATGSPVASYAPLAGLTDANGEISSSKTWPSSQGLSGWARKYPSTAPFYKQGTISIPDASGGTDILVTLQEDA